MVASEVKSLAEATRQATQLIGDTVRDLDGQVGNLIGESGDASVRAKNAGEGAAQIQDIIVRVQDGFTAVGQRDRRRRQGRDLQSRPLRQGDRRTRQLAKGVDLSSTDLKHADERVARAARYFRNADRDDRRQRRGDRPTRH